jgi:DNA-binding transcriptional regulator YhcF (GntR family)
MQNFSEAAEERPNYFAVIPADVRYDKTLSASEKLFYAEIVALTHKDGRCWASRRYFADLYGVDERTISRWTTKLAERGYIEVRVIRNAQKAILRRNIALKVFHTPSDKNVPTYGQKCPYPSDKNVAENNTSNNNKVSKVNARPVENFDSIIESATESSELREALIEFVKFRKLIKKPMTNKALELIISKLNKIATTDRERVEIINQSIERGWAGVFALKSDEPQARSYQPQVNPMKLYNMPNYGLKEIPR